MLISPTAVMKQINALERHLGLKLFERSNQGVVLTPVGRSVYDYALQMKQYSKQALDDIHRQLSSDTAILRIGTSPLNPCEPFLNVWYKINSAFPRYSLNLISFGNEYSEVFSAHTMLGDKLDFVVGTCDPCLLYTSMVPVLSSTTIWVRPVSSRDTAFLKSMPFLAPIPLPTIMATGVASPRAHGQLMTSTEIPLASAKPMVCPARSQTIIVTMAMAMTAGTNTPDTLSATLAIGALVAAASLTICII